MREGGLDNALGPDVRSAVRDLIVVLADSKRLLGMRYADWILGAPELEAGIACASMAQDEWGHGRLLYSLLKDFDEDVDRLEHGREPHEYASMQVLDRAADDWSGLVALNAFADAALTVQFEALRESSFAPLRQRVQKLLDEERFHAAHGTAWVRRFAHAGEEARAAMNQAAAAVVPSATTWFGPDDETASLLLDAGVVDGAGSDLRQRYLERLGPLLTDLAGEVPRPWTEPQFDGFDARTRRSVGDGPDPATLARIRGDKNRAFLMD